MSLNCLFIKKLKKVYVYTLVFSVLFSICEITSCTQQKETNTLRMNICSEPDSFFPWKNSAADTRAILYNIFEGLTTFDQSGTIKPNLAQNYTISNDGLKYVFNIRKGIKFHDGTELTGEDVVYTYKNLAGLDGLQAKSDEMKIIKNVYLEDEYTVAVELKQSTASFLTFAIQPILKKDYTQNETAPIGTGPYKFKEYTIHQKVVLTKNENYWNKDNLPKIENIELYIMSDESSIISALQSNQLDIAQMINGSNAKALSSQFNFVSYPQNMVQIFAMNNKVKPFDNYKVRKAICLAINKKEIIQGALDGLGTEVFSNFSPVLKTYYNENLESVNSYNLEKAKLLMQEAGYQNGFDITLTVPSNYTAHVDTAQIIKEQLKKININAKIECIEWATWLNDVYSEKKYQTTVIAFSGKLEPNEILKRYFSTYKRNFVNFENAHFDKNFTDALTELDDSKRIFLYKECQKILAEECPCAFISDPNNSVLLNKKIKGFMHYPVSFYNFSSLYFE